ncbi:hypothetical protein EX30DRAFT_347280 [Ascodesmis nigricans]|uniref:Zn(2)-C6 fungal-type domain-containing protein n=1 Tax=Ascodesmis nigricans TaxID=341454 RepID=A0A4V6RHG8_9PEZI|nr:hypothetical protein EX30DRAFT_347280 [Ascodesmis nigricans]
MATSSSSSKPARPKASRHNSNPAPPPPRRIHIACDECRNRKLKCTSEKPNCARCRADGSMCHYSPQKQMGRPRKKRSGEDFETATAVLSPAKGDGIISPLNPEPAMVSPESGIVGSTSPTSPGVSPVTTPGSFHLSWRELPEDLIRLQHTIGAVVEQTATVVHEQLSPSSIVPPESHSLILPLLPQPLSPFTTESLRCTHTSTFLAILSSLTPFFRSTAPLPHITLSTCITHSRHALTTIRESVSCTSCLTLPISAYTSHLLITVLLPLIVSLYLRTLVCIDEDFGLSGLIGEGRRRVRSAKSAVKAEFQELLQCCELFEKISRARQPASWVDDDDVDAMDEDGVEGLEEEEKAVCRRVLKSVRSVAESWRIGEDDGPITPTGGVGSGPVGTALPVGVPIVMLEDVVKTDWKQPQGSVDSIEEVVKSSSIEDV